ncbi:MAG: hypothetical protein B6245_00005, partial [Desulfobacteraceae bacterium 4572_88]
VTENQGDCDDTDAEVSPNATEICGNGKDDDCADGDLSCDDADIDEDGYSISQGDCDDSNADINPGQFEICGDEIDQDCNGNDVLCPEDVDDDEDGFTENEGDCDDTNSGIRPGARDVCGDEVDQDCDGSDLSCDDADNDGDTFSENQGDCDDADENIYPGADEICGDGIDQDCDESDMICLEDIDNDGDGFTENQGDCNDEDPAAFPGADEICSDGIDQDCDETDLLCPEDIDDDGDSFTENQNDCNDADDTIYPGAEEVCGDGIDQDCDGSDVICAGDSGDVQTGVFLFNLVVGVEYRTSTLYGVTNSQGEFKYAKGENVTFSVGSIVLGMALGQNVITPVDLVEGASDESDPTVTNICRLLMTLDDDGNPDNGISITDKVRNAAAGMSVDFSVSFEDFELNTQDMIFRLTAFTSASVRPLVSVEVAQTLLVSAIASIEVRVSNIVTVVSETQTSISWDPVATADAYMVHVGYAPGVYEMSYEVTDPNVDIPINSGEILYFAIVVIQGGIEISVSVETPTFISQGSVSGQVVASEDGTPIPNATIHLDIPGSSIDVLTDIEGNYAIEVPSLGDYCLISAGKEGYVPATANISKELLTGVDTLVMNFELDEAEIADGSVIILEILPEVHHLGDDDYTGAVNSQFQKLSEGITFTRTFSLTADQLPQNCMVSESEEDDDTAETPSRKRPGNDPAEDEDNLAELRLVAKGAQERNIVHINGNLLSATVTDSPEDGSFGEVILPIDASYLKEGENTLTITSIDGGRTFDDFEFANVLIYLYCQEIIIGDDGDGDGYTLEDGDCDDTDPDAYPGAAEICGDGIDQDCDGTDMVCTSDTRTWTDLSLGGTQKFRSVWGSAANNVFVVGEKGTILHYDGIEWTTAHTGGTKEHFYDVWGCSADSVFVVGEKGTVLHYDGTDWTSMSLGKSVKLYGIWGSSCDNVFVAGEKGAIYHYDGIEWTTAYTGTSREHFYDVWGCSGDDVYEHGASLRWY